MITVSFIGLWKSRKVFHIKFILMKIAPVLLLKKRWDLLRGKHSNKFHLVSFLFTLALVCPAKDNSKKTSSVVPIAVGGALAGLIVIVLVAYLIGRRRGSRGYQKV